MDLYRRSNSRESCASFPKKSASIFFVLFKKIQVKRYAAENHIGLKDADVGPGESFILEVVPGFSEREGEKVLFVGDAVVEATFVVDDVAYDPGCGAPADNQEYFFVFPRPIVPEAVYGFDEAAFGRSQARQFINENDHSLSRNQFALKQRSQGLECLHPGSGFLAFVAIAAEVFRKGGQFFLLGPANDAGC